MIVTTTNQIDGKRVTEYLDIVTGTDIYLAGGLLGGGAINQEKLFGNQSFPAAKQKMLDKAVTLNANAIIGTNVEVIALSTSYLMVVVSGTAVKITGSSDEFDELPEL